MNELLLLHTLALLEVELEPRQSLDADLEVPTGQKERLHHGSQHLDGLQADLTAELLL